MLRVSAIKRLKYGGRLFLLGVRLVLGRCVGQESQCVKHLRLGVLWVLRRQTAHRPLVVQRPGAVGYGGSVLVDQGQRVDELALAFGTVADLLRPLDLMLSNRNCRGRNRRVPKLVKVGHGNAPMCHRTIGILVYHLLKCIFGRGVSERVQQRDASVELLLDRRSAGNRKRYFSELLRRAVLVCLLCT